MIDFLKSLIKPRYKTLNIIEIYSQHLLANFSLLQEQRPNSEIIPVLKANAYGHGLKQICKILKHSPATTVAVDSFPEAQIANKYFGKKILIMAEMPWQAYGYLNFNHTEFVIYNSDTLKFLANKFGKRIHIHLFINTGMNREGIKNLSKFLEENKEYLNRVKVVGVTSHLVGSETDSKLNAQQEETFKTAIEVLKSNGYKGLKTHLGNSGGVFGLKYDYDAYRAGICFYGYNILPKNHPKYGIAKQVKPALRIISQVTAIQKIKAGETVSYNEKFTTSEPTTIAIVPFGYFEGLSRKLSNQAEFKIINDDYNYFAKIAGAVCMNIVCLDCKNQKLQLGDAVEIISLNSNDKNSITNLAKQEETIIYESLAKLATNIRRKII